MHIHHLSLYTNDLERMVNFYRKYFGAVEYSRYQNPVTGLSTCVLEFDKGCLLEIMTRPGHDQRPPQQSAGYIHLAMHAGEPSQVDFITQRLSDDGHTIQSQPRTTGDYYYESVVLDPDGNLVEITSGRVLPPKG